MTIAQEGFDHHKHNLHHHDDHHHHHHHYHGLDDSSMFSEVEEGIRDFDKHPFPPANKVANQPFSLSHHHHHGHFHWR